MKTKLVRRISEEEVADGYSIVAEFMASQEKRYRNSIERDLKVRGGLHGPGDERMLREHYVLKDVKSVRNCGSHGSVICLGMTPENKIAYRQSTLVQDWLDGHGIKNGKNRRMKLRNSRVHQLVKTIVMFDRLGCVENSSRTMEKLGKLGDRLSTARERFGAQNAFTSYLVFLSEVLKKLDSSVQTD